MFGVEGLVNPRVCDVCGKTVEHDGRGRPRERHYLCAQLHTMLGKAERLSRRLLVAGVSPSSLRSAWMRRFTAFRSRGKLGRFTREEQQE